MRINETSRGFGVSSSDWCHWFLNIGRWIHLFIRESQIFPRFFCHQIIIHSALEIVFRRPSALGTIVVFLP